MNAQDCKHDNLARVCELCELEAEIADRDARIAELEAEIAERDAAHRRVVFGACAPDERHCTCVPALRAEVERLRAVLRQTCVNECGPEYRDRDLHAPGCLADEAAP